MIRAYGPNIMTSLQINSCITMLINQFGLIKFNRDPSLLYSACCSVNMIVQLLKANKNYIQHFNIKQLMELENVSHVLGEKDDSPLPLDLDLLTFQQYSRDAKNVMRMGNGTKDVIIALTKCYDKYAYTRLDWTLDEKDNHALKSVLPSNFYISIITLWVVIFNTSTFTFINAQLLSNNELNSVIFLIRLYGSTISEDETSICASMPFQCQIVNGGKHITEIFFTNTVYTAPSNVPDPAMIGLQFPELTSMLITAATNQPFNPDINLLTKIGGLPKLTTLSLASDPSIVSIPIGFLASFPKLNTLSFSLLKNLTDIGRSLDGNPSIATISIVSGLISNAIIDSSLSLPNLTKLTLTMFSSQPLHLYFNQVNFPLLNDLKIYGQGSEGITVHVDKPVEMILSEITDTSSTGFINPTIAYPQSVKQLTVGGPSFQINPDITQFINLESLTIEYFETPPTFTSYPPALQNLKIVTGKLQSIPNVPFPAKAKIFNFDRNILTGSLPTNLFQNNPKTLQLIVGNNLGIGGLIPDEYCSIASLNIRNTSFTVTDIPPCFWCYSPQPVLSTTLVKPTDFVCDVIIDNYNVNSVQGLYTVSGDRLGWGTNVVGLVSVDRPNKQMTFQNNNYANGILEQNITISFLAGNPNFTKTITVTEIGFNPLDISLYNFNVNEWMVNITFDYLNTDYLPSNISINGQHLCLQTKHIDKSMSCLVNNLPIGNHTIFISNSFVTTNSSIIISKGTIVTSISLEPLTYPPNNLILNGYFGENVNVGGGNYVSIVNINSTESFNCSITQATSDFIKCQFDQTPLPGPSSLYLVVENGNYSSNSLLYIPYPIPSNSIDNCINRTNNCNNHGTCVNGQCVCDQGYFDDCKLQGVNVPPQIEFIENEINPSAIFQYFNYSFAFNMMSIQELDIDDQVVMELPSVNWTMIEKSNNNVKTLDYRLVVPEYPQLILLSTIEFSNSPRTIVFGGDNIELAGGSIKMSVNITNWPFQNLMSHLRILFTTTINNQQDIVGCDDSINPIESLENSANDGNLQYLRVVQDDIQFFGRFLSFSVSDGRKTYSKTEVSNLTRTNDKESVATIGISLPQAKIILMDPDFSALLIDRSSYGYGDSCGGGDGDEDKSTQWKLIVGVVMGVVGASSLIVLTYIIAKKQTSFKILQNSVGTKLRRLTSKNNIYYN
ncbi:hypothetical protein DFA_08229 [Cavenderia fasciculata]|uniref:ComC supersandwich domain-containing protein n=1 Tax=Cavenderia fasciculata TaxID=261658 RepID=F4Q5I0_CACFS|nr:uncharacterized protein DFA_08229 [Cavenderia fasciculata]EGG17239.1 hypothetical protein DFA_08229 [Cavenderia fasciculata]|eukprot:XP_004355723.1 hypothetical protein DFA_08229 [Cavenderia fasciculata]